MSPKKQSLEQQRAAHSLQKVNDLLKLAKENKEYIQKGDDYASYVVRLPAEIRINGLGQALAQLLAACKDQKKGDPHYWLYCDLQDWLCRDDPLAPYPKEDDLLRALIKHDHQRYQQALAEAMAWLKWHSKITVAYLKKKTSNHQTMEESDEKTETDS